MTYQYTGLERDYKKFNSDYFFLVSFFTKQVLSTITTPSTRPSITSLSSEIRRIFFTAVHFLISLVPFTLRFWMIVTESPATNSIQFESNTLSSSIR